MARRPSNLRRGSSSRRASSQTPRATSRRRSSCHPAWIRSSPAAPRWRCATWTAWSTCGPRSRPRPSRPWASTRPGT
ncbi:MAG: hypothetical protein F4Y05_01020 [Acidimicrobiaceae bacterium]|nr:hypothetical protein [Acidimicrobiaceae bacterium]MYE08167.1 hypothetical protein [Acidimicrobiaceae bacterium]MYI35536.1 hypothetical protein [Acidimicrobiaceae bacterium]